MARTWINSATWQRTHGYPASPKTRIRTAPNAISRSAEETAAAVDGTAHEVFS